MTARILFVDDEPNVLASFQRQLRRRFDVHTATDALKALEAIKEAGPFAVVVSDMRMPGTDGAQLLNEIGKRAPDTVRVMLTGDADQATAVKAVNEGNVFRFLTKPCSSDEMTTVLDACIAQHRLIVAEKEIMRRTLGGVVKMLVEILSTVDPVAFGQTLRLRDQAREVARALAVQKPWEIELATLLSQIGWLAIPAEIATKAHNGHDPAALTSSERAMIERAPEIARDLIADIPRLEGAGEIIYYQNKGYDGQGFPPDDVAGDAIPIGARILKVLIDLASGDSGAPPNRASFERLERNRERYDPNVLAAARTCLMETGRDDAEPASIVELPVARLREGDILDSDIACDDGTLVLAAGNRITHAQLVKLKFLKTTRAIGEPVRIRERPQAR